jgi:hypothetical protein
LHILAYQNVNDARYYVPVIVQSRHWSPFKLNFLIDTGASRTQISWSDATTVDIVIRALPPDDSPFTGMGGTVPTYILKDSNLVYTSNMGRYDISMSHLSVSDHETTDGRPCPILPSVLGIDILSRFDILIEGAYAFLRLYPAKVSISNVKSWG